MKQTLEEAAREHQSKFEVCNDVVLSVSGAYDNGVHDQSYDSFIAGAEWQSRQLPWINVNERLPEYSEKVLVLYEHNGTPMIQTDSYFGFGEIEWKFGEDKILAWMPIPSFDEILEANRDVLKRLKRK